MLVLLLATVLPVPVLFGGQRQLPPPSLTAPTALQPPFEGLIAFRFDAALGAEVQLTRFGEHTRTWAPAWSPRGDRIAFTSNDGGNDEIWLLNVDGTQAVHITDNTWEWDQHPSWSPEGTQLVFSSNRVSGWRNIWIMDAGGSNPRNLSGWCECND
ncbi:MAG: hypothetical protein Q9O62_03360 [Ardenticatenia bacterium]|nr:hypothetical protein [Ardenticatenia bacterium]